MNSQLSAPSLDYVFQEGQPYPEWLRRQNLSKTASFIRGDLTQDERAKMSPVEAARYQTIATFAGFEAMNRMEESRHQALLQTSQRQTREQLQSLGRLETYAAQGNQLLEISNELSLENNQLVEVGNDLLRQGNEILENQHSTLIDIEEAVHDLSATFSWLGANIMVELGSMGKSLNELVAMVNNPSKTWALEQYVDAVGLYRKRLIPEAYSCLDKAIEGHGSNAGSPYDHRFHYLRGLIHLGSLGRYDELLVDQLKAKEAFLLSAKYGKADFPRESARALVCAARASYNLGNFEEGLQLCCDALGLNPNYRKAEIIAAKCAARLGMIEDSSLYLQKCLRSRPSQLYSIVDDNDLVYPVSVVDNAMGKLLPPMQKEAHTAFCELLDQVHKFINGSTSGIPHSAFMTDLCDQLKREANHESELDGNYHELSILISKLRLIRRQHAILIQEAKIKIALCAQFLLGQRLNSFEQGMISSHAPPKSVKELPPLISITIGIIVAVLWGVMGYLDQLKIEFNQSTFAGIWYLVFGLIGVAIIFVITAGGTFVASLLERAILTKPIMEAKLAKNRDQQNLERSKELQELDQIAKDWGLSDSVDFISYLLKNNQAIPKYYPQKISTKFDFDRAYSPNRLCIAEDFTEVLHCPNSEFKELISLKNQIDFNLPRGISPRLNQGNKFVLGQTYTGKIVSKTQFGVFMEAMPNINALLHISEIPERFKNSGVITLEEGNFITAKCIGIDDKGRAKMSYLNYL